MHRIATNDEGDEIHEASVLRRRERRKRDVSRLTVLPYWINFNARGIIEQVHRGTRADTRVRIMQSRMLLEFDRDKWCVHVIFVKWARPRLKVDDRKWNIEFGWISNRFKWGFGWLEKFSRRKWKIVDTFWSNLFRWILILIKRWFKLTLGINLKGTRSLHLVLFNIFIHESWKNIIFI